MKIKRIGMAVVMALGSVGLANGATITWTSQVAETEGSHGQYLTPGLFNTNGAPLLAENVGGWDETFDGINFVAGTTTFGGGTTNNFNENGLPMTGTFGTTGPDTVTLTGLTNGTNYVIQALIFDGRNSAVEPTANGRTIEVDGIDGGQYASGIYNVTWGTGRLLTGTFTADAPTQSFTLEAFNDGTSYGGQLNALTLFDPNGTPPPPPPPFDGIEPIPTNAPTAMQQAQIDRAYGMFCHFGINTFHDQEWTDGTKPASSYAPTAVDADQWVRVAYESGMRYFIMISKHHDGFCMWDSAYTTYDVGSSGNTTDVVRAVADACEKYGLSLAIYYSLWDRHEPMYGSSAYIDYMEHQLTELLTNYGPVAELWFDGGWDKPNTYWKIPQIYDLVKRLQPDCQVAVNWSIGLPGNPDYHKVDPVDQEMGYPIRYFPSDFRLGDPKEPKFPDPKRFSHPDAIDPSDASLWYYMPFESTVTLSAQNKWFHNTTDLYTKSLKSLERTFNLGTAQNNMLVLNSPPNRDGVLIESNVTALHELAARLGLEPGRPIPNNVALNKSATASSVWQNDPTYGAGKAVDGNPDTRWASEVTTPWLEVDLGQNMAFDRVILNEYLDRVQSFKIEYWDGAQWLEIANGTTIGESLRLDFPEVVGSKVRLSILSASDYPSIWNFKVQFSNSGYRQWREAEFGPGFATDLTAQDTADPDEDGLPNILEYVLDGYDPQIPDSLPTPTTVSIDGRNYIEYRLVKRPGVSPESLLAEYKLDLQADTWVVPVDSGNGDIMVEDTSDHWLFRMDLDLYTLGFFRARTTIW